MESIVVNEAGEMIVGDHVGAFIDEDQRIIDDTIGYHGKCGAEVKAHVVSGTHYVLLCSRCGRIMSHAIFHIPIEIDTLEELRDWCARKIKEAQETTQSLRDLVVRLNERADQRVAEERESGDYPPPDFPNHGRFGVSSEGGQRTP